MEISKEYLLKLFNKGYMEGREDCRLSLFEALSIAAEVAGKDSFTLNEIEEALKGVK